jgi:hypothetical protein
MSASTPTGPAVEASVVLPVPLTIGELRAALRRLPPDARLDSVALVGRALGPDADVTLTDLADIRLTITVPATVTR